LRRFLLHEGPCRQRNANQTDDYYCAVEVPFVILAAVYVEAGEVLYSAEYDGYENKQSAKE